MTWLRAIGVGVTSVRACFLGVSWASARAVAPTTSMEAGTTPCRISQAILGNMIGGGAIDAQGCSSPGIRRLDGAQQAAVTSISPAVTTACRTPAASPTGSGAIDARACSTAETQVLGSAQRAADTTTQAAGITASLSCREPGPFRLALQLKAVVVALLLATADVLVDRALPLDALFDVGVAPVLVGRIPAVNGASAAVA